MAGEKVTMILRSRTELSDQQIADMSDAEGWQLIYSLKPQKSQIQKIPNQICFTGFSPSDKDRLVLVKGDRLLFRMAGPRYHGVMARRARVLIGGVLPRSES